MCIWCLIFFNLYVGNHESTPVPPVLIPTVQSSFYTFLNSSFWQRENGVLLPLMHFPWSVFLKATILSPLYGCSLLLAWALTPHSRLSLAPCGHSLPCWGLYSLHRPVLPQDLSSHAWLSFPKPHVDTPPQPACALTPHALCLFSDALLTALCHTVLGHWIMDYVLTALKLWLPWLNHLPNVYTLLILWILIPHTEQPHHVDAPHSAWALTPHPRQHLRRDCPRSSTFLSPFGLWHLVPGSSPTRPHPAWLSPCSGTLQLLPQPQAQMPIFVGST